jgi:feruloyl esterase
VDGIVEDPELCRFRPEALQCPPQAVNTTGCLTSAQVGAVRATFTDFYGDDGKLIFPRMQPGSEIIAQYVYYTSGAFPYSTDWFRYVVYSKFYSTTLELRADLDIDDSNWNPATFTIQDAKVAEDQNPFDIATWNPDISAFRNAGGKLRKKVPYSYLNEGSDRV